MKPPTPYINLLVIRSANIETAASFYELIGLTFQKHSHGSGPEHYACETHRFVFEIYPLKPESQPTTSVRLGFAVADVDSIATSLSKLGAKVVSKPKDSEWGRRCVLKDLDGHTIELIQEG